MIRRVVAPLRECVGHAVAATAVRVLGKSWNEEEMAVEEVIHRDALAGVAADPVYESFFPKLTLDDGSRIQELVPMNGTATFPLPVPDFPLGDELSGFASIAILSKAVVKGEGDSKGLWIELQLDLDQNYLIGGVCLSGMPYLPYTLDSTGRSSSNYGLPREIRLTWELASQDGEDGEDKSKSVVDFFLDDEEMLTRQQMLSHSGIHLLKTPPIYSNHLRIRFADFPRILSNVLVDSREGSLNTSTEELSGILIPILSLFSYAETTRFRPHVAGGLLASAVTVNNSRESWAPGQVASALPLHDFWNSADSISIVKDEYYCMSAASVFGQGRTFRDRNDSIPPVKEFFRSPVLQTDGAVRIYVEQADSFERCIAGILVDLVNVWEPRKAEKEWGPKKIRAQVYEVDPQESVAPTRVAQNSRYLFKLYDGAITRGSQEGQKAALKFLRPSLCRHFLVLLTVLEDNDGSGSPILLRRIGLIQSATVALPPRPGVNQNLRAVHFRFIGPDLGTDYGISGPSSAALSIERLFAGERREVLFEAMHLLDLVHSGVGRLISNHRYEEIVREDSTTDTSGRGWRRSETGAGVAWSTGLPFSPPASPGFRQFGNQETRTHTNHLAAVVPEKSRDVINALLKEVHVPDQRHELTNTENGTLWRGWRRLLGTGTTQELARQSLRLAGLVNVNVPPGYGDFAPHLFKLASALIAQNNLEASNELLRILSDNSTDVFMANGLSLSGSLGLAFIGSANGSMSLNWSVPVMTRTSLFGDSGTISVQGTDTPYSYSQHLASSGERTQAIRRIDFTQKTRRKGYEVQWYGQRVDIVTGSVPIRAELPGLADHMYQTSDQAIRVRVCGGSPGPGVSIDVWFEVDEEPVQDDR